MRWAQPVVLAALTSAMRGGGPEYHSQHYWKGQETVARLSQREPSVDPSPAVWKGKREARAKLRRLAVSIFEVRGIKAAPADLFNAIYRPVVSCLQEHQRRVRRCCGACRDCSHDTTWSSTDTVWMQFDDAVRRYRFKPVSDDSYEEKAQSVVVMQSSVIGGEILQIRHWWGDPSDPSAPAPPDAPAHARGSARTLALEPPACSLEEASGREVYKAGSQQWEAQPDVVLKFHSLC